MTIKKYKDYEYIVHWYNRMGHFNGYVKLPDDHKEAKKLDKQREFFGRKMHVGYDDIDIDCHGGLTFGQKIKEKDNWSQKFTEGYWIGWDYGHVGDSSRYCSGREYSEKEVEEECKNVIRQLIKLNK